MERLNVILRVKINAFMFKKAPLTELHFFGGLKFDEIAEVSDRTPDGVAWDMRLAKAWLRRELGSVS